MPLIIPKTRHFKRIFADGSLTTFPGCYPACWTPHLALNQALWIRLCLAMKSGALNRFWYWYWWHRSTTAYDFLLASPEFQHDLRLCWRWLILSAGQHSIQSNTQHDIASLSVRLSRDRIVLRRLNRSSRDERCLIACRRNLVLRSRRSRWNARWCSPSEGAM